MTFFGRFEIFLEAASIFMSPDNPFETSDDWEQILNLRKGKRS
jgi:hypothetical protein